MQQLNELSDTSYALRIARLQRHIVLWVDLPLVLDIVCAM